MKLNKHFAVAALALAAAVPAAQAHEFWLLPSSTVLSSPGYITVDAAVSNDIFYFNYRPLGIRDNLDIVSPDGAKVEPESMVQGKLRTVFDANLQAAGTYRLAIANSSLMASWKEGGETKRWRGAQAEMAANVPAKADELTIRESLELVPVTHPNDLYEDSPAVFTFAVDGKPAAGIEVEMIRAGTRYRDQLEKITLTTNADGQISHTWKHPGMYYLKAGVTGKSATMENVERRLSYVTTLEVLAQ